ncbi:calcium-binding protein [Polaromonas sp. YR568]|uniref:calcium-binding protein n=1 Tax=Polaromonas sp. YR568 TaxID=1855301 RepID=UPI00398C14CA
MNSVTQAVAKKSYDLIQSQTTGFAPLNTPISSQTGNTQTDVYWVKDSSGNYVKNESITIRDSDRQITGITATQYKYNSDGTPLSANSYRYDNNGNLQNSQPLVPTSNGQSWTNAPSGTAAPNVKALQNYFIDNGANSHSVTLKEGATLDRIVMAQKNAGNNISLTDLQASNPGITDLNGVIPGQVIYIPQKMADGSITYNYEGGTAINSNAATGEYHIVVPNAEGGNTVYSRTSDGNALGGEGYTVKQSNTDGQGNTTYAFTGRQLSPTAEISPVSVIEQLNGVETSSFYGSDGTLTGRSKTLDNADGAPTSDTLANMLQSLRNATGDMDDLVLDAAELRTLSGSQAEGEAWGGARLLMLGDSALGDYYRHHHDLQTGAAIPLQLDDPETQGLGLLDGFDLGNGASVLDSGNDTSTLWNYQAPAAGGLDYFDWGYDSSVVDYAGYSYDANTYSYNTYTYDSYDYSAYHYGSYDYGGYNNYDSYDYDSYDYGWSSWWPVALDMDNDGIELVAQEDSHAWYDIQGDGYRRNIGWLGSDDAFLAIDENHDGKITDARELSFAMWTADTGDTDLQALQTAFDTNHDQKFDAQDSRFADLRVWQDKNGDGVSDAGELKTLAEAGIKSISLSVAQTDWSNGGNHVAGFATYEKTNGTRGWAADVGLGYDTQGWKASVESNLVRMTESGGLVYGIARTSALNLDLGAQGLDGAIGGAGRDLLAAGSKKAVLLEGGAGDDRLVGGAGDDWLAGDAGSDMLLGGDGDDTLVIDAQDGQGNLDGGAGFDMAVVTGNAAVSLDLGAAGIEAAVGGVRNDNLRTSGTSRVILAGGAGNDVLAGSAAGDLLYGGTGDDTLQGGRGNDVYVFNRDDGTDDISDAATAIATTITTRVEYYLVAVLAGPAIGNALYQRTLDIVANSLKETNTPAGHPGYSQLLTMAMGSSRYWQYTTASRSIDSTSTTEVEVDAGQDTLRFGVDIGREDLVLTVNGADWMFSVAHNGVAISDRITLRKQTNSKARIEFVEFADGQKYAMEDLVFGTTGADVLAGTAAANVISGGTGADAMRGGAGNDVYVVDSTGDSVVENTNEGTDTVLSSVSYSLGANVENLALTGAASVNGTGNALNNTLSGNAGNNVLDGGLGDDTLDGGQGSDVMQGGAGNDTYVIESTGDVVTETSSLASEIDTVLASVSYALGANVENLTLTGAAAINGAGNALSNVMTGNGAANVLDGGQGDDTLDGGAGADTLNGGTGDDRYRFGLGGGRDTIIDTGGNDRIVFGAGISAAQITASMANGQVTLSVASGDSVSFAAPAINNYAVEKFEFAAGSMKDAAWLNALLNIAPTGANKTLTLNEDGSYAITAADLGFADANPGDSLSAVRIDSLPAAGSLKLNGAAVTAAQVISAADLAAGRLVFTPAANANGNSYAGLSFSVKDQYGAFDTAPNTLTFNVTAINDAPTGAISLLRSGMAVTSATTVQQGDVLNVSSTLADVDGLGAFSYQWQSSVDGSNWNAISGATASSLALALTLAGQTLRVAVSYTDGFGTVERVTTAATAAVNRMVGTSGADTLAGTAGVDRLEGLAGNDSYTINNAGDVVLENSNEGIDNVTTSIDYTLTTNVENLSLTGMAAISGFGNAFDNMVTGNGGINTLRGGWGNDTLGGGAGDDVMDQATLEPIRLFAYAASARPFVGDQSMVDVAISGGWMPSAHVGQTLQIFGLSTVDKVYVTAGSSVDATNMGGGVDDIYLTGRLGDYATAYAGNTITLTRQTGLPAGQAEVVKISGGSAVLTDNVYFSDGYIKTNALLNSLKAGTAVVLDPSQRTDASIAPPVFSEGADSMAGGLGNDTFMVDDAGDVVTELAGEGTDTVQSYLGNYTLAANVENLTLMSSLNAGGTGNALNNIITGNSGNNVLQGGWGNDMLSGGAGDDVMDTATPQPIKLAILTGSLTAKLVTGDQVINEIAMSGSWAPSGHVGQTLQILGSSAVDKVYVTAGSSVDASGLGGGIDEIYLTGRLGDYAAAHAGNTITLTRQSGLPAGQVEVVKFSGGTAVQLDNVYFSDGFIQNYALSNAIKAGTAAMLDGSRRTDASIAPAVFSEGADSMAGGMGNDTFMVDDAGDVVTELAGEGTDTVQSYLGNYTLAANVENLTLVGSLNANGTGNALDNELTGNASNNTLAGGAGSDTYQAYRGMAQDRIVENDATVGNTDVLSFITGVSNNQLWFSHTGNDLAINIIGTADRMTVQNWYLGNQYHVEQIKTSDNKVLLDTQVEALVQAMAGFVPPSMGQTTLTAAQQTALAPVLAANWH